MRRRRLAIALSGLTALAAAGAGPAPARADEDDDVVPWLGITFTDHTQAVLAGMRPDEPGIHVDEVYPRTAASRAGVVAGDEIVAIDGAPVASGYVLRDRVVRHAIGDRVRITVRRDGRELELGARLTVRPRGGELIEQRLLGAPLPPMNLGDRPLTGRPALVTVFDARCDGCGGAASALAERARDRGAPFAVRTVIVGTRPELDAYLARKPIVGAIARWETVPEGPRGAAVLSGLSQVDEGAIVVVDAFGVVQFAASTADVTAVADAALAAAARAQQRWRRGSPAW